MPICIYPLYAVLEDAFGKSFSFVDHTYDNLCGSRSFHSFQDYVNEEAVSRIYGVFIIPFLQQKELSREKK